MLPSPRLRVFCQLNLSHSDFQDYFIRPTGVGLDQTNLLWFQCKRGGRSRLGIRDHKLSRRTPVCWLRYGLAKSGHLYVGESQLVRDRLLGHGGVYGSESKKTINTFVYRFWLMDFQ